MKEKILKVGNIIKTGNDTYPFLQLRGWEFESGIAHTIWSIKNNPTFHGYTIEELIEIRNKSRHETKNNNNRSL